jgi:hypothetical protein
MVLKCSLAYFIGSLATCAAPEVLLELNAEECADLLHPFRICSGIMMENILLLLSALTFTLVFEEFLASAILMIDVP